MESSWINCAPRTETAAAAIFIAAAPFGLIAIAVGYVVRAVLLYPLSAGASLRILSIAVRRYAGALVPAFAGSALMAAVVVGASHNLPPLSPWLRLASLTMLGAAVYLAAVLLMARPAALRVWHEVSIRLRRS